MHVVNTLLKRKLHLDFSKLLPFSIWFKRISSLFSLSKPLIYFYEKDHFK